MLFAKFYAKAESENAGEGENNVDEAQQQINYFINST